jgi:Bacterial Ig domain/Cadherin-like beta sandwich domain/HYR domain/Galactose oxidase, central domain/Kelch motif/Regulator of chromosome condensation (RCC1) repeat
MPLGAQTLTWSTGTAMNAARSNAAAVVLNDGKVLVTGGRDASNNTLATADLYNPATGTWSTINMVAGRWLHRAEKLADGRVLVIAGAGNPGRTALNTAEIYNPATGTFTAVANLAESRETFASTVLSDGKVLVHGGWFAGGVRSSGEVYDPATNTWTATGSSVQRNSHELVRLTNGKVLMTSGHTGAVHGPPECFLYDPATNAWTATGSMGTGRAHPRSIVLANGKVLTTGESLTCELYDPSTGTWSYTGSMSVSRGRHHAIELGDGKVLAIGGGNASSETYNPATGTWSAAASLNSSRVDAVAVRLANGDPLIAGGYNGSATVSSMEIFDGPAAPQPLTWATGTAMNTARRVAAAVVLNDGKVLVTGGLDADNNALNKAEIYDPIAGTWSNTGNMVTARWLHKAEKLSDGRVLVMGGRAGGATTEIYNPATGTFTAGPNMAFGRDDAATVVLADGRVLNHGGWNGATQGQIYNPTTNTWTSIATSVPRITHELLLLPNGKVLMIGSYTGGVSDTTTYLYDPVANTWTASGAMAMTRYNTRSVLLPNGKVLTTTAPIDGGNTSTCELYDIATGTWSYTGSSSVFHNRHHVGTLGDGRVVAIAGGTSAMSIYNPATGTWATGSPLSTSRQDGMVVRLLNGKFLAIGGHNGSTSTNTVEIFDGPAISGGPANNAPTDIALSVATLAENNAANATVGTLSATDADAGQTHSFSLVSGTGSTDNAAFNISGTALRLTGSADFETKASYSVRIQANDGNGGTFEKAFAITVTNVNDAPTDIALSAASIAENNAANASVGTLSATDADAGATHSFSLVSGTGDTDNAAFNISGTALRLTGSANFEAKSSYSVRVQASDGALTFAKAFTITVTNVNEAPIANAQSVTTAEDIAASITLTGSDVDAGTTLTFAIVTGPTNGTLTGTGATRSYTPAANFFGSDSFTFRANDGALDSSTATVSITVTAVNDAPVATAQSVTTNEDTAVSITLAGMDVEGSSLTFSIVSSPTNGSLTGSGASRSYTPAANFSGTDSFTFRVNDGTLDSAVAIVSITVTAVNDAPTDIALAGSTIAENNAANATVGTLSATDADVGATHSFSLVSGAGDTDNAAFNISGSALRLTGSADFETKSSYSIRVQANDGAGGTFAKAFSISVTNVNEAPLANAQSVTTDEDTAASITLTGSDVDAGTTLTFAIVTGPANGTLTGTGAGRTYTPAANFFGTDSFTFKANDGTVDSATATISITVTAVNDAPLANAQSVTTNEDTAASITLTGSDVDAGATLTFAIVTGPANGTLSGSGASRTYTPAANFFGTDSFTFKANDGTVDSATATVSITVTAVNDAPLANAQSVTTDEDTAASITLTGSDVDAGTTLTFAIVAGPANGTLTGTGTGRTYTPAANFFGTDSFTFKANDGTVDSATATISITVTAVNDAPLANAQSVTTNEDTAASITLTGSDVDAGATLTFAIITGPANGTLSGSGAGRTYTPAANFFGTDSFTFKVNDGTVDSATATVSITVTAVNDAPLANAQSVTTDEDTAASITLTGSDVDAGTTLTFAIVAGPTTGTLTGTGATRTYTPAANFSGTDSFTFKANDGTVDSAPATVSITVTAVNDAPTDIALSASSIAENNAANATVGTLNATDVDAGAMHSFSLVSGSGDADNAAFNISGNALRLTSSADFEIKSSYSVRVQANDGAGGTFAKAFSISVTNVNEAPSISSIANQTIDEDMATGALSFTLSDPEGGTLVVSAATSAPALVPVGAIALSAASGGPGVRTVTVTPLANQSGTATITLTVTDAGGLVASTAFGLTVTAVNDAPTISDISDQAVSVNASTGDIPFTIGDIETSAAGLTLSGMSSNQTLLSVGSIVFGGSGASRTVTLTPVTGMVGSTIVTVTVSDGTASSTDSFELSVSNGTPTISAIASQTIDEDGSTGPLAFFVNDTETAATSLVVTAVSDNTALVPTSAITLGGSGNSRTISVTPVANQNGAATLTLTVSDGLLTASRSFLLTVTAVNDVPTISAVSAQTTAEDTPSSSIAFTIGDVESSAAALSVSATSGTTALVPASGIALGGSGANRSITLTPAANASGTSTITLTVSDGTASASSSFVLTVTPVNDAPLANAQSVTTDEDTAASVTLSGSDVDAGTTLTFAIVTGPTNGTLTGSGASRTYTPAANFFGTDSFTFKANDGTVDSATATVSISVTAVNDAPLANAQSVTTDEDTATSITLTGSDVDAGTTLTFEIVASPTNGTLTGTGASRSYTPAANFSGTDSFTFKANDGTLDSATATVSITATAVNDSPLANAQSVTTAEDTVASITLTGSDVDAGTTLTFAIVTGPTNGTLSGTGASRTYTPAANFFGTDSFTFKANDGTVDSATATVSLTVTADNDAPLANAQSITTDEDTAASITLTGSDVDAGTTLTFAIVTGPTNGTLSGTDASRSYTPAPNFSGTDSFTFKANDGTLDSTTATVSITVTAVNDAPLANAQSVTTDEDTAASITLTGSDVDAGTTLTFAIVAGPTNGTLNGTGASRTYTPAANFFGTDSFTFKANDGTADSATATVSITVTSANDAPLANAQSVTTDEDTAASITLTGSDVDAGTTLTFAIVAGPTNGTLSGTGASRSYTPAPNFSGTDSFTFKANDGTADSAAAMVSITVTDVNDAPTITAIANQTINEDTATTALSFTLGDAEGGTLVVSSSSSNTALVPVGGISLLPASGGPGTRSVTVTPLANQSGSAVITLTVSDGTLTASSSFTVAVTAVNDTPTISDIADQSISINGSTGGIPFTIGDLETAAGSLTVSGASSNGVLLPVTGISFGGSGTSRSVTLTPTAGLAGSSIITVTVSDGSATASDSFELTVNNGTPTLSAVASQIIDEDGTTGPLAFFVNDAETPAADIVVTATSGNTALVPAAGLVLGGSGNSRSITVTPAANANGSATITLTASDGVLSASRNFTVTVTAVNDAPTISSIADQTTAEDTATAAIAFTVGDAETAPASLTVSAASSNTALVPVSSISLGGGGASRTVTINPVSNLSGNATITLSVNDGTLTVSRSFVVTVTAVNDAPLANAQSVITTEDASASITLSGTDVEGSALTFSIVSGPTNGTLTGTGANRTYTPAANFFGSDSFTFTASDGMADSAAATVAITVTAENDAPTISTLAAQATDEDTATAPLAFTVGDAETAAAALTVTAASSNTALVTSSGLVHGGSGAARTLVITPLANASGTTTISLTVSDGMITASSTFVLTVIAVNDAPVGTAQSITTAEDTAAAITLTGIDPEGSALTLEIVSGPANGTLSGTGASRTYTPAANFFGSDSFSFRANDGTASSAPATVAISVTAVNDAPTITLPAPITREATGATGAVATFAITGSDVEDGALTGSSTPASGASFALGSTTVSASVTDGGGLTATGSFTVTVRDTTAPSITPPAAVAVTATSSAGAVVTYAAATATDLVTASPSLTYSRASGTTFPVGVNTVTVTATDAAGNAATATFSVSVAAGLPVLFSPSLSRPTTTSVLAETALLSDGGGGLSARGFVFTDASFVANPVIGGSGATTALAPLNGAFAATLSGFGTAARLAVRAFAIGPAGTAYSGIIVYNRPPLPPSITTGLATNLTYTSADLGGTINASGGIPTERGIRLTWASRAASLGPVAASTAGIGDFTVSFTSLPPDTKFFYTVYARNNVGYVEGGIRSFQTPPVPPTVATVTIGSVLATSAAVSSSSGGNATERGFVYIQGLELPVLGQGTKVVTSGTSGQMSALLSGLRDGTRYTVRTFATGAVGTVYSAATSFTTAALVPLNVQVASGTRSYGLANPPLAVTINGRMPGSMITATAFTSADSRSVPGIYDVTAVLSDPNKQLGSYRVTIIAGKLTVTPAPTIIRSAPVTARFDASKPSLISLAATVTSTVGVVGEGTVRFQLKNGSVLVGQAVTGAVTSGVARVSYPVPVGTQAGALTLDATYTGTIFGPSSAPVTPVTLIQAGQFLTLGSFPPLRAAGQAGTFVVTVRTATGAVDTAFTGTLSFSSSDPTAVLPSAYTFTTADAGQKTFSATLRRAGMASLTATYSVSGAQGTQGGIQVTAKAPRSQLMEFNSGTAEPLVDGSSLIFDPVSYAVGRRLYLYVRSGDTPQQNTVHAWGVGEVGQLGSGRPIGYRDAFAPVLGIGGRGQLTGAVQVSVGNEFSMALLADGTVATWGSNWAGQLGNPSFLGHSRAFPELVPGLSGVKAIAAGTDFAMALKNDGSVWVWGNNAYWQCSSFAGAVVRTPLMVLSGCTTIACGGEKSLALLTDGRLASWGRNSDGELARPAASRLGIVFGQPFISGISAGYTHSLLLKSDGTGLSYGSNRLGQLAQGIAGSATISIGGRPLAGIKQLGASNGGSTALLTNGSLYRWGNNRTGVPTIVEGTWNSLVASASTFALLGTKQEDLADGRLELLSDTADAFSGSEVGFTVKIYDKDGNEVDAKSQFDVVVQQSQGAIPTDRWTENSNRFTYTWPRSSGAFNVTVTDRKSQLTASTIVRINVATTMTLGVTRNTNPDSANLSYEVPVSAFISTGGWSTARGGTVKFEAVTDFGAVMANATFPVNTSGWASGTLSISSLSYQPGNYTLRAIYSGTSIYRATSRQARLILTSNLASGSVSTLTSGASSIGGTSRGLGGTGRIVRYTGGGSAPAGYGDAPPVTASYRLADQDITITGKAAGTSGSVVISVLNELEEPLGSNAIVEVASNGTYSATITLPGGTAAGTYFILHDYMGTAESLPQLIQSALTIQPAAVTLAAQNVTTPYRVGAQMVDLSAAVDSPAGTLEQGTVTFEVRDVTGTPIGTSVTATVADGIALARYALPAGQPDGIYTLRASYQDAAGNLEVAFDDTHTLQISYIAAPTVLTVADRKVALTAGASSVIAAATITSEEGTVTGGMITFQLTAEGEHIGSPVTAAVAIGTASATLTIPAGTPAGFYGISASYDGTADFEPSTGRGTLSISDEANARLASLAGTGVQLSPAFDSEVTAYSAAVPSSFADISVIPRTADAGATVTVNGQPVASGTLSLPLSLASGSAMATIVVTAADGTTTRTYTASFTREANHAPANLALENGAGLPEGTLSATDPDTDQTLAFSLVPGAGDTDNDSFIINGSTLSLTSQALADAKPSYSVRVRALDDGIPAMWIEASFTFALSIINTAPSITSVAQFSVEENSTLAGAVVAEDASLLPQQLAYTLSGPDAAKLSITDDGILFFNVPSDYENPSDAGMNNVYNVTVTVADTGAPAMSTTQALTITVTNVNEAPTEIALSNSTIAENNAANATIGTLTATGDPDAGATHSFSLVSGTGDTDNGSFTITGSTLKITPSADFETKSSYSIRVQADDGLTGLFAKAITITITDVNEMFFRLSGNGQSIANGDVTPSISDHTDFGSTGETGGNVVRTFTISNPGTNPLLLTGTPRVAISGSHAAEFAVSALPASSIPASGTTTFQITFDPAATGLRSALATLTSNDSTNSTFTFAISGTGRSSNANLASLSLGSGTLTPAFAASTLSYTATLPNTTTSLTFTAAAADSTATLSGSSSPLSLAVGSNTLTVTVTAEDAVTVKAYTVIVTRQTATQTAVQSWAAANSLPPHQSGPNDDPDSDGKTNFEEFAFGTHPGSGSSGSNELQFVGTFASASLQSTGQPVTKFEAAPTGTDFRAVFIRRVDHASAGLIYTARFSANMATWQSSVITPTILATDGTHEVVSVPYPFFIAGKKVRFFQISVSAAP